MRSRVGDDASRRERDTIVFRTDPGSKLRGLLRSPAVCYQIGGFDPAESTGWSVLVTGRASEVRDPDELRRMSDLPLRYRAIGDKPHWIRIVPEVVTGRRIWTRSLRSSASTAARDASDR